MKNTLTLGLAIVLSLTMLSGCGSDDDNNEQPTNQNASNDTIPNSALSAE